MKIQWIKETTLVYKGRDYRIILNPEPSDLKDNDLSIFTQVGGVSQTKGFSILGPGEYSYRGVTIIVKSFEKEHSDHKNIVSFSVEGMMIVVLNGLIQELSNQELEFIGNPDILCVQLTPDIKKELIIKLISNIDPRIVIPIADDTALIQDLTKEYGISSDAEIPQELLVKKSELPFETTEIRPLKPGIN